MRVAQKQPGTSFPVFGARGQLQRAGRVGDNGCHFTGISSQHDLCDTFIATTHMMVDGRGTRRRLHAMHHPQYALIAVQLRQGTRHQPSHRVGDQNDFHTTHLLGIETMLLLVERQHRVLDVVAYIQRRLPVGL